jgi:hypothetical protein
MFIIHYDCDASASQSPYNQPVRGVGFFYCFAKKLVFKMILYYASSESKANDFCITNGFYRHRFCRASTHIFKKVFRLRQMEKWQPVVTELDRSLFGEQMVCSASTQLFHIPETKDLRGNAEMHTYLVPASYHRVTAAGSAQRLLYGETAASIVETLIACIQNSEQKDRNVRAGLLVMRDAAPASYKPFVENIILWQDYAELHLQNAKQLTLRITSASTRIR